MPNTNDRNITALLDNKKKNSRKNFEILQNEVYQLSEKLLFTESIALDELLLLLNKAMTLIELDIYLPLLVETDKDKALKNIVKIIPKYCEQDKNNVDAIVDILNILSRNNFEIEYDYGWLNNEKIPLFQPIVQNLYKDFILLLKVDNTLADKKISLDKIAMILSAISVWHFRDLISVIKDLVMGMELRFNQNQPLSAELSFNCLDGITRLIA